MIQPLTEEELNAIYNWVDKIPLSKPKRNISRDFSDGVLLAEVLYYFVPRIVDLHNYSTANSGKQKKYNWETLNKKVFKKMGFQLSSSQIESVIQCAPEAIERVLIFVQEKIEEYLEKQENSGYSPKGYSRMEKGYNPLGQGQENLIQNQMQGNQQQNDWQKDQVISELRETIEVLEVKLNRMNDLMKQKDQKIQRYQQILMQNGLM